MSIKNWCYWARAPLENASVVMEQMRLAHRYRNRLVGIELDRRRQVEEILQTRRDYADLQASVKDAEFQFELAVSDIQEMRRKLRSRVPATKMQSDRLDAARKNLGTLSKRLSALKKEIFRDDPQIAELTAESTARSSEARKAARAESGLYWGTYLTVEDAAKDFGKGAPPRFTSFSGDGSVAVQFQNGLSAEDALSGNDTRIRFEGRYCYLRVGSDEKKKPIWAKIPIKMDRPLPENGLLKWAHLHLRHIGPTPQWMLRLVVEADYPQRHPVVEGTNCAVHIGWRMVDGKLRVATLVDDKNEVEHLELSAKEVQWLSKRSSLQSIRDREFASALKQIKGWLEKHDASSWLRHETETIGLWKSARRLHRLIESWRNHRFEGDSVIFHFADCWRRQDKHLWLWQAHGTAKQRRRRSDTYRKFANAIASRYTKCGIQSINLGALMERQEVDEDAVQQPIHRRLASLASCGTLLQYIKEAMGDRAVCVDSEHLTSECCFCEEPMERGSKLVGKCESCGKSSDQDVRAARNQLKRISFAEHKSSKDKKPKLSKRQQTLRKGRIKETVEV